MIGTMRGRAIASLVAAGVASTSCGVTATATVRPDVLGAVVAAGGACGELDKDGERRCNLRNISFKLSEGEAWTQTRSGRKLACAGDYINANWQMLTDGHWFIATDRNADYSTLQSALADQRIASDTRNYCE